MKKIIPSLFSITFLILTLYSCKDDVTNNSANDIIFPDSNVSYGRHVEPLFLRRCAIPQCHNQTNKADGLSLYTYQDAMSSKVGVIIPRDTSNSRLVWRIEPGARGLLQMPLNLPPLTPNQIKGLKTWILEAARNN